MIYPSFIFVLQIILDSYVILVITRSYLYHGKISIFIYDWLIWLQMRIANWFVTYINSNKNCDIYKVATPLRNIVINSAKKKWRDNVLATYYKKSLPIYTTTITHSIPPIRVSERCRQILLLPSDEMSRYTWRGLFKMWPS